jgi:hypothetical protein
VCGRFEGEWNGSWSVEDERFAARMRCPGDVLEGPGPVTVEGQEGCREVPNDLPTVGVAKIPTSGVCRMLLRRPRRTP